MTLSEDVLPAAKRLVALLEAPEYGLLVWNQMVIKNINTIHSFAVEHISPPAPAPRPYRVELFSMHRYPQGSIEIVQAYTAEDAHFQAKQRWPNTGRPQDTWFMGRVEPATEENK